MAAGTDCKGEATGACAIATTGKPDAAPTSTLIGRGTAALGAAVITPVLPGIGLLAELGEGVARTGGDAVPPGAAAGRVKPLLFFDGSANRLDVSVATALLD